MFVLGDPSNSVYYKFASNKFWLITPQNKMKAHNIGIEFVNIVVANRHNPTEKEKEIVKKLKLERL